MMENQSKMHTDKQIPAGFKLTEVGVIPEDWAVEPLSMITEPKRPISYGIVQTGPSVANGIPCIRVVDISNGKIQTDNLITTSEKISESYRRTILQKDDILIPLRGKVGEIAIVDKYTQGANLTRGVALIAPKSTYDSRYIKQYLSCKDSADRFLASMNGSALQEITIATLRHFSLALPSSLKEQIAIGNVLSDIDVLISELEKLIAKKQAIKTATMQQLLTGRTRLPQFSKYPNGTLKGYATGELGHIPVDWEVVTCGEIGKFRGGSGFPTGVQGQTSGKYPFYKVSDMNNDGNGIFMSDSNNWISSNIRKLLGSTIFPAGSIIFAKVGAAIFLERKKILTIPSCIDNNLAAFELDLTRCEIRFIHYILLNLNFGDYVSTTALPSLSGAVLSKIKIVLPSIKEQMAIASILSDMDAEIEMLEKKLAKFHDIKQGMMQQLLTGRIRLPLEQQQ